ncbi:hypothetical protein L873DRAFT_1935449 [Choiromyces venosus 120613-1]|uniref:Uncharacterized protein n=1 Tax=Choiromyces venosus 120613-1 TaxID=1336337 RepID=A0A3N4JDP4_9PEZI|nr:hypothetical protein L873DRAFT_1935449 [Choiromyces venosus 120613-1]
MASSPIMLGLYYFQHHFLLRNLLCHYISSSFPSRYQSTCSFIIFFPSVLISFSLPSFEFTDLTYSTLKVFCFFFLLFSSPEKFGARPIHPLQVISRILYIVFSEPTECAPIND